MHYLTDAENVLHLRDALDICIRPEFTLLVRLFLDMFYTILYHKVMQEMLWEKRSVVRSAVDRAISDCTLYGPILH
jgi:DNA-binding winged helix-turn-helix (wHTH) protein